MGRLVDLAHVILSCAENIEHSLQHDSLNAPSFGVDAPDDLPPHLHDAQNRLLEASDELTALVQGPRRFLISFMREHFRSISLQAIVRLKLAKRVPLDGTSTPSMLATHPAYDEGSITRLLRHAMSHYIFTETGDGRVAHTAASRLLAVDERLADLIQTAFDNLLPAASRAVDAMERWPNSQEPSNAGFNVANKTTDPIFVAIDKDPDLAQRFANTMQGFQDSPPFSIMHLAKNIDLQNASKLVDIGGSSGSVAILLAQMYPHLQCVVQDQPQVVEHHAMTAPPDVANRVRFMSHDFFHEQPINDADVYLIRWTLHDWSDLYTARIIRNVVPAMKPGATLIINDSVMPNVNETSKFQQQVSRCSDMTMWAIQNGKERDEEAWKEVLKLADARLHLDEVRKPPGSALDILIVTLRQ